MVDILIREYEEDDWQEVRRIHDLARPIELEGSCDPRAFVPLADDEKDLEQFEQCRKLVASAAGRILGFVGVSEDEVGWLYVDPEDSGKGIGRKLLREGVRQIRTKASVYVLKGNTPALNLYASEGFARVSKFDSENNGYPCVVLKLSQI
ncbi:MAG: GNAT family N-acetyltransferase [Gammaproteobacteria bacterium]|jgi:ribosomal protein S18 acetylase RimI-like enzyme|nr:GNAT family N-acetyltransferase [Gammaproteobacteria bacterium]|tara:strand:+ start:396 stop:845 length:450 start_codon:yes stop_codon:yes gene_type:complete